MLPSIQEGVLPREGKMKLYRIIDVLCAMALTLCANGYLLVRDSLWWLAALIPLYLTAVTAAGFFKPTVEGLRLNIVRHGAVSLVLTLAVSVASVVIHIPIALRHLRGEYMLLVWSAVWAVVAIAVLFFSGIISVYLTSGQLGVKWRVLGVALGFIPIINLVILGIIIDRALREADFESFRIRRNRERRDERVAATRYPILMVHGFFFRDWALFNYWGRIFLGVDN